jgi:lipopolysaccharide transport system ATP-binding protein
MSAVIRFDNVSKVYQLGESRHSLREALAGLRRGLGSRRSGGADSVLWALRDVSFEVVRGEALGIIGPNGAGKTTILKLLSRITQPTSGRIDVSGRVSALIELGAGFHPDLSGRENIYLNAAILGLPQKETARRFDSIVAFSGLERFVDTPVKRYSSGMYVRLGFSVAAHVEPDVLLVDEVLAVGDAQFRQRCAERMRRLRQNGTTIVFISHNMHMVRTMCDRALLLSEGRVCAAGDPAAVISEYEKLLVFDTSAEPQDAARRPAVHAGAGLLLRAVEVLPVDPGVNGALASDRAAQIRIHYSAPARQPIGRVYVEIAREDGTVCSLVHSGMDASAGPDLQHLVGDGVISVLYQPLQLAGGTYSITVGITDVSDSLVVASVQSAPFRVSGLDATVAQGVYVPSIQWAVQLAGSGGPQAVG